MAPAAGAWPPLGSATGVSLQSSQAGVAAPAHGALAQQPRRTREADRVHARAAQAERIAIYEREYAPAGKAAAKGGYEVGARSEGAGRGAALTAAATPRPPMAAPPRTPFMREVAVLFKRTLTEILRNPALLMMHCVTAAVVGLFCGGIFWKLDTTNVGAQNRLGAPTLTLRRARPSRPRPRRLWPAGAPLRCLPVPRSPARQTHACKRSCARCCGCAVCGCAAPAAAARTAAPHRAVSAEGMREGQAAPPCPVLVSRRRMHGAPPAVVGAGRLGPERVGARAAAQARCSSRWCSWR